MSIIGSSFTKTFRFVVYLCPLWFKRISTCTTNWLSQNNEVLNKAMVICIVWNVCIVCIGTHFVNPYYIFVIFTIHLNAHKNKD